MGRTLQIIAGIVVALALCGLQQSDKTAEKQQSEAGNVAAQRSPAPVVPPYSRPEMQDPGCTQGEDDRQSDLCAQWKAADAARSAADAAWWLGAIGILVGGLTLAAAWRAARWAKAAAHETKRTADLADADQRPWVSLSVEPFKSFNFVGDKALTEPNVKMTNHGKRVARNVVIWAEMYVHVSAEAVEMRNAALERLHARIQQSLDNPKYHRRLIFPGQFATFAPAVMCESVPQDIYRLLVLAGYDFEGSAERHFTWAMFDILTADNQVIARVDGPRRLDEWMATATGVGDAT